ncbi:MAG TPA: hypothetical protein PLB25_01055 [Rhodoferax sp.]|nr:hypothetical protein [Rhodoferax sp.]
MVVVGAGRIHLDGIAQTEVNDPLAKHAIGGRASADIAHADKKNGITHGKNLMWVSGATAKQVSPPDDTCKLDDCSIALRFVA